MSLDIDLGSGVSLVFGTPILIRKLPDADAINGPLRNAILKAEAHDKGAQFSNADGWQSAPTLLDWPVPEIATLRQSIEKATLHMARLPFKEPIKEPMTLDYTAYGWANVNRNSHYNTLHNHGEYHWAFVYYVDCGNQEPGHRLNGRFEVRDPRPAAGVADDNKYPGFTFGKGFTIDPEPGMLLAFPAWMDHQVHPFFGSGERISIAVNVRLIALHKKAI
jgi:uncharacterized protein (TIGR02466 family)